LLACNLIKFSLAEWKDPGKLIRWSAPTFHPVESYSIDPQLLFIKSLPLSTLVPAFFNHSSGVDITQVHPAKTDT
jgi:hypothetical protein